MTTWREAHALANVAAAQAHRDLRVDTSHWRVDPVAAITRADVLLLWRPLPLMFGAYLNEPGDRPGILINSRLPVAAGRHTAGHELGHHFLGHATQFDNDLLDADDTDGQSVVAGARSTRRSWPGTEKAAEAFASWFLMPRRSVLAGLRLLDLVRPRDARDAYQLSVMLGVPYRSLVRHLLNIRLAGTGQVRAWSEVPPSRLKASFDGHVAAPASRRGAVWATTPSWDGHTIPVVSGDRVVLPASHQLQAPLPRWLLALPARRGDAGSPIVLDVASPAGTGCSGVLHATGPDDRPWSLEVCYSPAPTGLTLP